jgi:TolB-like protein/rhodanese-related sulfurtransferase
VVGYDAISNAIIKLRKAFGDDPKDPQIIETIPKAGYRLIAAVEGPESATGSDSSESEYARGDTGSNDQTETSNETGQSSPGNRLSVKIVLALVLLAGAAMLWLYFEEPEVEPASAERMAYALPDKPSIAVMPFVNMSADPEQEYFVDGMTEDLITDLSKFSGLFVVARNSVFTYKGKTVEIRQVAEELGVHYVLEGSARRAGEQVRINAQLIDALSGGHVWAERYDGELGDIFMLQDQITRNIVAQLASSLDVVETSPSPVVNAEAYDLYLKGWGHYRAGSPEDHGKAVGYYRQALEIEPDFARARAALAAALVDIHQKRWWFESLGTIDYLSFERARQALIRSREMPIALTHQVASEFYAFYDGNARRALAEAEKAIDANPNDPAGHLAMAFALLKDDRAVEAEQSIRTAMRLDPHYPPKYLFRLGQIQFHREQYTAAVESLQKAIARNPNDDWMLLYLAASYGKLQQIDKGQEALARADDLRAKQGWGPITLLAISQNFWGWHGDIGKLKDGLRAIDTPRGGEWYSLISQQRDLEPPQIEGATNIDVQEAHAMHKRGVLFIDVHFQWNQEHIPGAVLLEVWKGEGYRFNENALRRYADFDDEIVVYSSSGRSQSVGRQAAIGAAIAVSRGFNNIFHFPGGLDAWKKAGYPVERPE